MSKHRPRATEVDKAVGARVHVLRKAAGLSQTSLGSAVGVTFQQVQKYEKGENRISAARLRAIAELLEVPLSAFFEAGDVAEGDDTPLALLGLPGAPEMLRTYACLTPELRASVLTLARGLVPAGERPGLLS